MKKKQQGKGREGKGREGCGVGVCVWERGSFFKQGNSKNEESECARGEAREDSQHTEIAFTVAGIGVCESH